MQNFLEESRRNPLVKTLVATMSLGTAIIATNDYLDRRSYNKDPKIVTGYVENESFNGGMNTCTFKVTMPFTAPITVETSKYTGIGKDVSNAINNGDMVSVRIPYDSRDIVNYVDGTVMIANPKDITLKTRSTTAHSPR